MAKKIKPGSTKAVVKNLKKEIAGAELVKAAKAAISPAKKGVTLTSIAKAHKPMSAASLTPPPSMLPAILKAGVKKIAADKKKDDKDAAKAWVEHEDKIKPIAVESDRPGVARNPKPKKVHIPLTADGAIVPLEIISYHFLKLMERLAAEQGGSSSQALQDLKADIAKRKKP